MTKRTIAILIAVPLFCALAFMLVGGESPPGDLKTAGVCKEAAKSLRVPWSVKDAAATPDLAHNSPHFSAPFSALGIPVNVVQPNDVFVFVSLRYCPPNGYPGSDISPCGQMAVLDEATERGAGRRLVTGSVPGMKIGYRRFWSDNLDFVGMCDALESDLTKLGPSSICRIWMRGAAQTRGLYVVVPGEVFLQIPRIMSEARQFLDARYEPCTV